MKGNIGHKVLDACSVITIHVPERPTHLDTYIGLAF